MEGKPQVDSALPGAPIDPSSDNPIKNTPHDPASDFGCLSRLHLEEVPVIDRQNVQPFHNLAPGSQSTTRPLRRIRPVVTATGSPEMPPRTSGDPLRSDIRRTTSSGGSRDLGYTTPSRERPGTVSGEWSTEDGRPPSFVAAQHAALVHTGRYYNIKDYKSHVARWRQMSDAEVEREFNQARDMLQSFNNRLIW
jgi:hypothetical protein